MTKNSIYYQKANDNLKLATNLMFVAIFLSIPRLFIEMDYVIEQLPAEFPFNPKFFLIGSQIISMMMGTFFILMVKNKKNWARWFQLIMSVIASYGTIKGAIDTFSKFPSSATLATIQIILNYTALYFLFQGPASELFRKKEEK